jgi:hypothetical protein
MKIKERTILACGICGEEVFACDECNKRFIIGDDFLCKENADGHQHYHKECI